MGATSREWTERIAQKCRGGVCRNVSIAVPLPGRNDRNGENGARGMRLISSRRERANESAGGGRETLSPHSNRGDEAVCCAREREFTAEVPLTD